MKPEACDPGNVAARCNACKRVVHGHEIQSWGFGAQWAWGLYGVCGECSGSTEGEQDDAA